MTELFFWLLNIFFAVQVFFEIVQIALSVIIPIFTIILLSAPYIGGDCRSNQLDIFIIIQIHINVLIDDGILNIAIEQYW